MISPSGRLIPRARIGDSTQRGIILFFVAFLLVFPKGGIKLAGVPVTWGYLGLALALLWIPVSLISGYAIPVRRVRLVTLALLVPFQVISWLALLIYGAGDPGFTLSFVVTFFAAPLLFTLVFGVYLDRVDLRFLFRVVRVGVLFVAAYGIFLFFYKLLTGSFIEIPLLTVNLGDVGSLGDKHIDRGGVFKLISTYNNGNIFGISLLILLPLYTWMEPSVVKQSVVKVALLLTLSRTVWIGLIAYELLRRVYIRRVSMRAVMALLLSLLFISAGIAYALHLMDVDPAFLVDRRLGGRVAQLRSLEAVTLLPAREFTAIQEIVYLSVLESFGLIGLAAFLVGMAGPLLLHAVGGLPYSATGYKRSLVTGLCIYLLVALSDGAILYIPVMAFYWFVASLLLSDNPSFEGESTGERGESEAEVPRGFPPLVPLRGS